MKICAGENKRLKIIIILSIVLIICGVALLTYSFLARKAHDCKNIINKSLVDGSLALDESLKGKMCAIYLVNRINTCCHPLPGFKKLVADPAVLFTFYVQDSFTDNDIDNFRYTFNIPLTITIERRGNNNSWLRLVERCRYQDDGITNVFILVNKNLKIEDIRRF